MSVQYYCQSIFPNVKFTGGSAIHASKAMELLVLKGTPSVNNIMNTLVSSEFFDLLYGYLLKKFKKMEFFISKDEFIALGLTDYYRQLIGEGASETKKKLVNPVTNNRFHRISLLGDLVGGFRVWPRYDDNAGWMVGYRFRLELMKPEEHQVMRQASALECEEALTEVEQLKTMIDIPEPYEEQVPARVKVRNKPY